MNKGKKDTRFMLLWGNIILLLLCTSVFWGQSHKAFAADIKLSKKIISLPNNNSSKNSKTKISFRKNKKIKIEKVIYEVRDPAIVSVNKNGYLVPKEVGETVVKIRVTYKKGTKKKKQSIEQKIVVVEENSGIGSETQQKKIGFVERYVSYILDILRDSFVEANWLFRILYGIGIIIILLIVFGMFLVWDVGRRIIYALNIIILGLGIYELLTLGFSWCLCIVTIILLILAIFNSFGIAILEELESDYENPAVRCLVAFIQGVAYCVAFCTVILFFLMIMGVVGAKRDEERRGRY